MCAFIERFFLFSIVSFICTVLLDVLLYTKPSLHRGLVSICLASRNLFQPCNVCVWLAGTCTKHADGERRSINNSQNYLKHGVLSTSRAFTSTHLTCLRLLSMKGTFFTLYIYCMSLENSKRINTTSMQVKLLLDQ